MPTSQSVQIVTYDFGSTLSNVTLRDELTDTLVATADSCPEISADAGVYVAVFGEPSLIAAGVYRLRAIVDGAPLNRFVTLTGVDGEVAVSRIERSSVLDSATRVTLAASQPDYDLPTNTELNAALQVSDDATLAAIAAEAVKTSAIKAKTDNLPTDPADQSLVEAAITAATSPLATPAQVNAQVLDVLSVDTFAELTAPPAATSSLKDKITWLFMYARNKVTQTAIARTLYRDDTTTVAGTSATSDNGTTFTKGEDT